MTDQIYPSHPELSGQPAPVNLDQNSNPYFTKAANALALPDPSYENNSPYHHYPMPKLPHNAASQAQMAPAQTLAPAQAPFQQSPFQQSPAIHAPADKLLQEVTWAAPAPANMTAQGLQRFEAPKQEAVPAYPPMPPVQTPISTDKTSKLTGHGVRGLLSAIKLPVLRRSQQVQQQAQQDRPSAAPISAPVSTDVSALEIEAKPQRPALLVFLIGALFGALITYLLTTTLAQHAAEKDYAVIAASQIAPSDSAALTKPEKLNDDVVQHSQSTQMSHADSDAVFLDEQLKSDE